MIWNWSLEGSAADEQTYKCSGTVSGDIGEGRGILLDGVMRAAFMQLTGGKAVFGKPGVGCRGPYTITKVVLELVP